ncbi:hypothetical protein Drose_21560 [Dactylosporangium roseum]|uniref:DUF4118 domain-containing protein n=1 Tax=Dactylosporangium roseum TaxID=47989 RepID=A0ABY5YWT3_9ACTN|nr:hypothetical protein [Dactylosporangium roseum]UWZ33859.1 hypothetical protein Drose_21560 [Dactylosporangium roseum]
MDRAWWLVRPRYAAPTGVTLAAGATGAVVVAVLCAAATAPSEVTARVAVLALWTLAVGAFGGDLVAAVATGAIAWTVLNGFLVNRLGVLTWHGTADAVRLGVLLGAAGAGWLGALTRRVLRHRRHVVRLRAWLHGDGLTSISPNKEASHSG